MRLSRLFRFDLAPSACTDAVLGGAGEDLGFRSGSAPFGNGPLPGAKVGELIFDEGTEDPAGWEDAITIAENWMAHKAARQDCKANCATKYYIRVHSKSIHKYRFRYSFADELALLTYQRAEQPIFLLSDKETQVQSYIIRVKRKIS